MKDPLMLLLVAVVGAFVYFVAVKGVIYPLLIVAMFVVVFVWFFANYYISRKMVEKARGEEDFYFHRCQMVTPDGRELVNGALVVTAGEIVFCKRKGYGGGVQIVWSSFTSRLESYSMGDMDEKHKGVELKFKKDKNTVKFCSQKIKEEEKDFRAALGWPEE